MSRYQYEVIDNLESTRTDAALSANQGRILNEKKQGVDSFDKGIEVGPNNKLNMKVSPNYTFSNGKLVYPSSDSLESATEGTPFSAKAGNQLKEKFRVSVEGLDKAVILDKLKAETNDILPGDLLCLGSASYHRTGSGGEEGELMGLCMLVKSVDNNAGYRTYTGSLMGTAFVTEDHRWGQNNYKYGIVDTNQVKIHLASADSNTVVFELKYYSYEGTSAKSYNFTTDPTVGGHDFKRCYHIRNYGGYYE